MAWPRFLAFNAAGGIVWTVLYGFGAYLLGEQFHRLSVPIGIGISAAALVVLPSVRLVVTEGNYLLLDDPNWARARRAMDAVWFVTSDETKRIARLVARHIEFGKTPDEATAWVATIDQPR